VHPCWTLADARAIAQRAHKGARVLQMGAGFIGCIIMEALAARGVQLTVVEMGDRMVPRMMGPTAGGMIKDWCENQGCARASPARASRPSRRPMRPNRRALGKIASAVGLGSGGKGEAGHEGDAVQRPVRPRHQRHRRAAEHRLPGGLGDRCLVGVLTDEHLQTNVPGVYAAGDCAEAFDKVSGKTIVSAIQPNAADQAYGWPR
jgi:hypothetical protein